MRFRWAFAMMVVAFAGLLPAAAQSLTTAQMRALGDALQMGQILDVMQQEAIANGTDLAKDLFGTDALAEWDHAVTKLFDPAAARTVFDAELMAAGQGLGQANFDKVMTHLTAPLGVRLMALEIGARREILDDTIEAAAAEAWRAMLADPMPATAARVQLIRDFVTANDLIDGNVISSLNSNLAFYQGMAEAGGAAAGMTADEMTRAVWDQEPQVRRDIEDWLYPYLALAYAPLNDAELRQYVEFSASPAGLALSRVLFAAFDALAAKQSRGMGLAAARLMMGQDI